MPCLKGGQWKPSYGPEDDPLHSFYIPALSSSIRYDRLAGYFSSSALAVAAKGVAKLVAGGGKMRLLVSAELLLDDVEAMNNGAQLAELMEPKLREAFDDPAALQERLVRERLKILGWLVAQGRLELRVVIPCETQSRKPIAAGALFHAKGGILIDEDGCGVAFSGSINETASAWVHNYERFHCFPSWTEPQHYQAEANAFNLLWADSDPNWVTLALPEAVKQKLIAMAPAEPPVEEPADTILDNKSLWLAAYLRDGPRLSHDGWKVGVETARIGPFPHQRYIAYSLLEEFLRGKPIRMLLADEVGLGKTIEAALVVRALLLSNKASRVLFLVPRTLVKQWQENLHSDFLINVPFYDGWNYVFADGRKETAPPGMQAWQKYNEVITSHQLVRMRERGAALLQAPDWDLVVVDEAHHARRRDFLDLVRYRPNRFLALMNQLKNKTKGMLLMTATPMQLHPVEIFDLLKLLSLPGQWADQERFLRFFIEAGKPLSEVDMNFMLKMLKSSVETWGWPEGRDAAFSAIKLQQIKFRLEKDMALDILNDTERRTLLKLIGESSPVPHMMYRHTRGLLKQYHKQGKIKENIPDRKPRPEWLKMTAEEAKLYREVEDYISDAYALYKESRKGIGFVLTVYRRRLTSSLYALEKSLSRRYAALRSACQGLEGYEDEDYIYDDDDLEDDLHNAIELETIIVQKLIHMVQKIPDESKLIFLVSELNKLFKKYHQVLIFTQYTDTMDFLRERLKLTFGEQISCYSGRGGEIWDSVLKKWTPVEKDTVQSRFLSGSIKVLISTEAGAEGLNLQSCGVMINYDLPWNPMKVEQRIGRIDRIGQTYPAVEIIHLLYEGTVEARVYQVLGKRLDWFKSVVGPVQPLLHKAEQIIEKLALAGRDERERQIDAELKVIDKELVECLNADTPLDMPWLEDVTKFEKYEFGSAPIIMDEIKATVKNQPPWKEDVKWLDREVFKPNFQDDIKYTFKQGVRADDVHFCSYGSPVFDGIVALPAPKDEGKLRRLENAGEVEYQINKDGEWRRVTGIGQLGKSS